VTLTLAATQSIAGVAGTASAITITLFGDEITGTTDAFRVLYQGTMPTSVAAIYTATSVQAIVKAISLQNVTAGAVTVSLYVNGTAGTNQIWGATIPANGSASYDGSWSVYSNTGLQQSAAATIPNDSVTNTMLAPMPTRTVKGNSTGATAGPTDLTVLALRAMIDGSVINANDVGILTSNTGAANVTAFNAWYAGAATFSTLYFPGVGFYDFASTITLNRDIRVRFLGAGKGRSILRQTFAAGDLFTQTVAAYYISFEELGFTSSVTKTSGAAIHSTADTAYLDVNRCEFTSQYSSIWWENATAGNIGTIMECLFGSPSSTANTDTAGGQIIINGSNINMMIQNCTINVTGQSVNGLVVRQCGAVQVGNCDFIGGRNTLLVNATGVVSALYFTNCFFDQATLGSTVKFMGTFATSRTKFIQCGITTGGGSGLVACEIAGTGTGTGIPEAIDFMMCDFYNNSFAGTTTGILITGVRGIDIRACRVSGFTFGIDITPYNGNGITNFNISDNTIGPTENFAGNGTGIRINAGSFQYGQSQIIANDISGNTTAALVDNGTYAANSPLVIVNNIGLAVAPKALVATPATFAAVETVVHQVSLPANSLLVGTTLRFKAHGTVSATAAGTVLARLRIGTLGTTGDTQVCATAAAGAATAAVGWTIEGYITIRSIGSGGTALGNISAIVTATPVLSLQTATVAVNTTVANFIELTAIGGGTSPVVTVVNAFMEVVKQ
jgi:hypothetical protein